MAKTNKKPTNFHALFFLQIFFRYSFVKRSLYRVKDVDSTRGQTVSVLWPLAISSLKEVSKSSHISKIWGLRTHWGLQGNHLKHWCKCVCKQLQLYLIYLSSCNATFLAISGTGNPSCSMYFVSVIISWSLGEKFTRNWTLFSVVIDSSFTDVYNTRKSRNQRNNTRQFQCKEKVNFWGHVIRW